MRLHALDFLFDSSQVEGTGPDLTPPTGLRVRMQREVGSFAISWLQGHGSILDSGDSLCRVSYAHCVHMGFFRIHRFLPHPNNIQWVY